MITQDRLKAKLSYSPDTGLFTRAVDCGSRFKAGTESGTLSNGYRQIQVDGKLYRAHRLAFLYMLGEYPKNDVDHIDGDRDNNKWSNLRPATRAENLRNAKIKNTNKSGFNGVCWSKSRSKWEVHVTVDCVHIFLGEFHCKLDAIAARIRANKKYNFSPRHGGNK